MPALITELIDKVDSSEIVRDQIAAILKVESENQAALAAAVTPTPKDPRLWRLRVFLERANPFEEFRDDDIHEVADAIPIVNVSYENGSFDRGSGNTFEKQKCNGTFNIDCYGYGCSTETADGH